MDLTFISQYFNSFWCTLCCYLLSTADRGASEYIGMEKKMAVVASYQSAHRRL